MLNKKTKTILSFMLRIGLSIGLLMYVFSKIDLQATVEALKTADLFFIMLAGLVFLVDMTFLLARWFIFIKALELSATKKNIILHFFYGAFGNLFMPTAIGGDIIKTVGLCRSSSEKPKVVASVLLDRLSGFYSIILIELCVLLFGYQYVVKDKILAGGVAILGGAAILLTIVLFNEKIYSFVFQLFNRFPKIKNAFMKLHYNIALLKDGHRLKEGFKGIGIAGIGQVLYAFSWFLVAQSLHQDLGFIHFMAFVPLLCLASLFPSVGGLGVREAAAVFLFSKIGMEAGVAVSMSLIGFIFVIAFGLVGGALYVYTLSTGRVQHHPSDAGVEVGQA